MRYLNIITFSFILLSACAGKGKVKPDESVSPAQSGDSTVMIRACGNPPTVGFAYCRIREGESTVQDLTVVIPATQCKSDNCSFVKIYDENGAVVYGAGIPKGQSSIGISWKTLLSRDQFSRDVRGLWTISIRVLWTDNTGIDRSSVSKGDILLRVFEKDYQPLNQVHSDPNFVWKTELDGYRYQSTSSLRSSVEKIQ